MGVTTTWRTELKVGKHWYDHLALNVAGEDIRKEKSPPNLQQGESPKSTEKGNNTVSNNNAIQFFIYGLCDNMDKFFNLFQFYTH